MAEDVRADPDRINTPLRSERLFYPQEGISKGGRGHRLAGALRSPDILIPDNAALRNQVLPEGGCALEKRNFALFVAFAGN